MVFGPIPENDSSGGSGGNPDKDTTFAFGSHEGLIATGGHVIPVWVTNQDGGNDGKKLQNIYTARVTIAAGPRIVGGTMGPVQSTTVTTTSGAITFNAPAADGTPQASGFVITFDRPVDPASFTTGDVRISYRDTNPNDASQPITASNVYPILGSDPDNNGHYGYTQFLVTFPAHAGLGTYSYSVGPSINARIRKPNQPAVIEQMDQNSNAITNQVSDIFSVPTSSTDTSTLPLIVYGATVASTSVPGVLTADGSQGQVDNGLADALDVTFDRPMLASSFTPGDILRMMGPTGLLAGPFTVTPAFNSSVTPDSPVTIASGGTGTSNLPISGVGGFTISNLRVRLDIIAQNDSELTAVLIPPPGLGVAPITLFSNLSLPATAAPNFTNTVFDDQAPVSIVSALPPFTGSYQPVQSLDAALAGKALAGNWSLRITDAAGGNGATLNSWSLEATPTAASTGAGDDIPDRVPDSALSGTYTFQIASSVQDATGNPMDENQNAGLDVLRGFSPNGTQVQTTYNSTASTTINPGTTTPPTPGVTTSTISVPDTYPVQGVVVQLNIAYPNDPDLTVTLTAPNGKSAILFSNVGATGTRANFTNTVFDDNATTPISNGGPPFFGHFQPMSPFTTAFVSNPNDPTDPLLPVGSQGTWTLTVTDSGTNTGTILNWSLTLTKKIPNSGLGEPIADQASASFRIFTMDPTNPLSSDTWTAVGPTGIGGGGSGAEGGGTGGRSGRIGGLAVDPSDPSGNTVYIGGASGGVWKTTDFLTTDPAGPTYIPLTDFGPSFAINIGSIAVFGRNNDPNQSIIFAGTGEGDTGTPGVGFLRSMDGGATWTLLDSTTNVDSNGNPLPINSPLRDHVFTKGTTTFKVVVDPKLSPNGNVIVYAALSGTNGGLWRSDDSGQHWQKLSVDSVQGTLATDVVLDPASGTGRHRRQPSEPLRRLPGRGRLQAPTGVRRCP